MAGEEGRGEQAGALDHEVWAACPNCGGQNRWGLLQRLTVCTYCDSRLLPPSLAPADWSPLAPKLLAGLLPDQAQVRFNPVILRRLLGAQFTAGRAELVYAPFPLSEAGEPVVSGPGGAVGSPPLFGGVFPPGLYRSVKRWMAKAPATEDR
ncbi:MAG: hypothetical protein ACP5VF_07025 [Acidobacteriota bacterium]